MNKNLKGIMATASMLALVLTLTQDVSAANANTVTATPSTHTFSVDGEVKPMAAYVINGNNYLKLRDIAAVVNGTPKQFEVGWDAGKNAINLTSNKAYTPNGSELTKGSGGAVTAQVSTAKVYKDSALANYAGYNIAGNNYYKLRDVADSFDIGIEWDGATMTSNIVTNKPYATEPTTPTTVAVPPTAIKTWDRVMSKFTGELYQSNNPSQYPYLDKRQYICSDTKKYLEIAKKFAPQITGKQDGTVEEVIAVLDNVENSPEEFGIMKHFEKTTAEFYADELRKALNQNPIYGADNKSDDTTTQTTQPPQETEKPASETEKPADTSPVTEADLRAWELEMVDAVNEERRKAGVPELEIKEEAMAYARYWAEHCKTDFRHSEYLDFCDYADQLGMNGETVYHVLGGGENIGYFYQENKNAVVSTNMKMVMDSPGHKATMLDPLWTHIGIGFAITEYGTIYCVQSFPLN